SARLRPGDGDPARRDAQGAGGACEHRRLRAVFRRARVQRVDAAVIAMERIVVRPAEIDFDRPGRRDYYVALEHDSTWGDHLIPLTVFVGPDAKPERGLVAFGSNHGNEYEGPIIIRHLL